MYAVQFTVNIDIDGKRNGRSLIRDIHTQFI